MRILLLLILPLLLNSQIVKDVGIKAVTLEARRSNLLSSLRGISAYSAQLVWVSGSGGSFARSEDGGQTWKAGTVPGTDSLDFRDVVILDPRTVLLMSAGSGDKSRIFKTNDAGDHWRETYVMPHASGFLCALKFWNLLDGIAFSDPVDGRFLVLKTTDAGDTWHEILKDRMPDALPDEYAFAASGTSLALYGEKLAWIGSGGGAARVFRSADQGENWEVSETPVGHDEASAGIFSVLFRNATHGVVVGGNYARPELAGGNVALSRDGGKSWQLIEAGMPYRSVVVQFPSPLNANLLVAAGRSGASLSIDGGETWNHLTQIGYYTMAASPDGTNAWLAGADGRVARLQLSW